MTESEHVLTIQRDHAVEDARVARQEMRRLEIIKKNLEEQVEQLRSQLKDEIECSAVRMRGADQRAKMLLDQKNYWLKRAVKAETQDDRE